MTTDTQSEREKSTQPQDLAWGCGLAIFGNILISVSLNLQKFVHLRNAKREISRHYTKDPLWWLSLLLMGLGEGCNFVAYGFAPASLVAPLGTTTVIANLFLAALFLREKVKAENLFGCALAMIGAILLVLFSGQGEKVQGSYEIIESLSQPVFIIYVCLEVLIVTGLLIALYYYGIKHVVIFLLISSITASFTVISAKAVSGMIQLSVVGISQWGEPVFYGMLFVLIVTALVQIKYLNLAMKNYDATVVVPINFVIFTASAILAGIIFYKEFLGMTGVQITMFLFGCLLSFTAVYFISLGKTSNASSSAPMEQITSDLIPSWMMANVNIGPVQPSGSVEHLKKSLSESDRLPILASEATPGPTDTQMSKDEVSITSMDMIMDRDKLGMEEGTSYGAIDASPHKS